MNGGETGETAALRERIAEQAETGGLERVEPWRVRIPLISSAPGGSAAPAPLASRP
jgi:hypothetical protein